VDSQLLFLCSRMSGGSEAVEGEECAALCAIEVAEGQTISGDDGRSRDGPSHLVRYWDDRVVVERAGGVRDARVCVGKWPGDHSSNCFCNCRTQSSIKCRTHSSGDQRPQVYGKSQRQQDRP
jgi:hypothetical protein